MKVENILSSMIFTPQGEYDKEIPDEFRNIFEKLFEEANEMIITSDKDGYIKRVNKRVLDISGYSRDELQGESILKIAHPDDRDKYIEFWKKILDGEDPHYTVKGQTKDGNIIHMSVGGTPIRLNGEIVEILYNARNITELEETKRKLEKSEERFRTFFESNPDPAFILDTDGRFVEVNEAFCEITDLCEDDLIGNDFRNALSMTEESRELTEKNFEKRLDGEDIPPYTVELEKPSGDPAYVEISADLLEEGGKPNGILAIAHDITERKKWEQALRNSEKRFRQLFEVNPDPAFLIDTEGVVVEINDEACETVGYGKEEIVGKTFDKLDFFPERTQELLAEKVAKALDEGDTAPFKIEAITKSGETRIGEINHTIFKEDEEVVGILGIIRDITEKERAKEKLQEAKEKYEDLFKGANELVITTDTEGYIKRVNQKTLEISGYSEDELVGESVLKIAPSDQEEKYIEFWQEILDGKETKMTLKTRNKDGSNRWIEAGGRPIVEDGEIIEIQYNAQDITERKKIQERQEFLYSLLRHDLRNKISVAEGYQDLLLEMELGDEQEKYIRKTLKASRDGLELIEKIRTLSKVGKAKLEDISLNSAIKEAIKRNSSEATEKGIDIEHEECECSVKADPLLEQMLSNLIENSIQHSGCDLIRVQAQPDGEEVEVVIEDDGRGIPDDIKQEIFEQGFRSGDNAGTGLGLNLVKRITESYDGSIEVGDSELGGAKFTIELKRA